MKAPSNGFRIIRVPRGWIVVDDTIDGLSGSRTVWSGKTFIGARNAHYRHSVQRATGKPVSAAQARRAGNA